MNIPLIVCLCAGLATPSTVRALTKAEMAALEYTIKNPELWTLESHVFIYYQAEKELIIKIPNSIIDQNGIYHSLPGSRYYYTDSVLSPKSPVEIRLSDEIDSSKSIFYGGAEFKYLFERSMPKPKSGE